MKNIIVRRIIILVSIALIVSSVLIASLGVFLSEGLIADIKSKEFVPDISVLSQMTLQYQSGNIDKLVFEKILKDAASEHTRKYIIYNTDQSVLFSTEGITTHKTIQKEILENVASVLKGEDIFVTYQEPLKEPIILIGEPILKDGKVVGAVFIVENMLDLLDLRKRFFGSLGISIMLVIPFVAGLSYLVLKRIIKPIKNVMQVALSIIKGDFSVRAEENLEGEAGLLGKTINMLSKELYQNISELFIEKNRLHQVLNSLEEGMIAVDEDGNITHFNHAFLRTFSFSEEMVEGKSINQIPLLKEELLELDQSIEEKSPIIKNIFHNDLIMRIVMAPIENEKNESVGAVILFRDITEFEKLETVRRDYVANVSHELRSPLTSIRGLIEPLKDEIVTEEADKKRYYEIIFKESMRLSRLIDDIMELSRLQTSEAVIEMSTFDLNPLIEMVYERYRRYDESIQLEYIENELPRVYSNYDRIEQIMVILLDNAFKFTPEGGKVIIQTVVKSDYILVSVKDTGSGISEEDLPNIFERFYKSDKSRTKKGTGLGLSIANEILCAMGEKLRVSSQLGEGSIFEFTVHTDKHPIKE